ncbi:MAG: VCBS repeat-containing protein [Bacteroidota bacterium]|nr:VCBS repeat-containing protein [Bacteroidota bacterium]
MKKITLFLLILTISYHTQAQYFTDIKADLYHHINCGGVWFDQDDDGDLDLILTGHLLKNKFPNAASKYYKNINRERDFTYLYSGIINLGFSDADAADYDNDGDIDILVSGANKNKKPTTFLYENRRTNKFLYKKTSLKNLSHSSVAFADYNRDGNQDIAISGLDELSVPQTIIYSGNGKGAFYDIKSNIEGVYDGTLAWGDYDNDGDYDLLISGKTHDDRAITSLYKNINNTFVKVQIDFPGLKSSDAAWGDYDNDGDVDFIICGEDNNGNISTLLFNNLGNNSFLKVSTDIPGVRTGSVDWGDFDHDGDLDILITGESYNNTIFSRVYRNDRDNIFFKIDAGITGVYLSDGAWGDYDNDGDLDLFISGMTKDHNPTSKIYRNERIKKVKNNTNFVENTDDYSSDIWNRKPTLINKENYYFLISSCFCIPDSSYTKEDFHLFISEVFKLNLPHYHPDLYFDNIIREHEFWGEIKSSFPSEGHTTLKEAQKARVAFIKKYRKENYNIHYIKWLNQPKK